MTQTLLANVKAYLLSYGTAYVSGTLPPQRFVSHAGPGINKKSFFFTDGSARIRLESVSDETSPVKIEILKNGAVLRFPDEKTGEIISIAGRIEEYTAHCPKQAYISITEGCIFRCGFCGVHSSEKRQKTAGEICSIIDAAAETGIECISITGGVFDSPEKEAERLYGLLNILSKYGLPVGVSVCPVPGMPEMLRKSGVSEVKFNLETASDSLFEKFCPGLDREALKYALIQSVPIFGRNHVFTNIIAGLGETEDEMKGILSWCCSHGIIPEIRPLTPAAEISDFKRPSSEYITELSHFLKTELVKNDLDPGKALTMCAKCGGCAVIPLKDF